MGSFDMSCAISGISLGCGQPTKLFFITEDDYSGIGCYPTDHFKFVSFGIDAKYDDYGYYEFDEQDPNYQYFLKVLAKDGIYQEQGENQYHEKEFDPAKVYEYDANRLFEMIYKGRVRVKTWRGQDGCAVQFFPVLKRVYDELCLSPYKSWRGANIDQNYMKNHFRKQIEESSEFDRQFFAERIKVQYEDGKISEEEMYAQLADNETKIYRLGRDELENREIIGFNFSVYDYYDMNGLELLIEESANMTMFYNFLYKNRIMVAPQMSAGQEIDYQDQIDYHEGCARIARELKQAWDEELDY